MFPNFCFSRNTREHGNMSVKTLPCLNESHPASPKKRRKSPVKSPKRLPGGANTVNSGNAGVHVNGILKKSLMKKMAKKRSRSSSPMKKDFNDNEKKSKIPTTAEKSVNFNLSTAKCHCGHCAITRSELRRESEKELAQKQAEFNRMRELQKKRAEQRRERAKRVQECLRDTDKQSDTASSEEYHEQKKLSVVLEQLREQQQKRLASFLADQNNQTEASEDNDGEGSKRLEESCADFLNIVHDNILETVQTAIQDKLSKYYDTTISKINFLTAQVARNETLLNRINTELLEKIAAQNAAYNKHLKMIVQKLNGQQPSQIVQEEPNVNIESCSSNTDHPIVGDNTTNWTIDQNKKEQANNAQQQQQQQIREQQQQMHSSYLSFQQPSVKAKKPCQCERRSSLLAKQRQFAREQQIQFANFQMMNEDSNSNMLSSNVHSSNMQLPYPMSCQNYLMWLNWNLATQYSNQNCCQHLRSNSIRKTLQPSTITTTTSRTRLKKTSKRFGSASLPNIYATKAKIHPRSSVNRSNSPRFMNIVNVASQHSEHKVR